MIAAFCALQRDWLEQELQQPSSSTTKVKDDDNGSASRMVQALHGLEVAQASVGLYGRTVLEFVVSTKAAAMPQPPESSSSSCLSTGASSAATIKTTTPLLLLPSHRFTTGDEVEIRHNNKQSTVAASGVISAVTETSLSVAVTQHNKNHNDKNNTNNTNKTTNQSQSHNSKTKKAASAATPPNGDDTTDTDAFWHTPNSTTYSLLARSNVQVHHKLLAALHELETKNVHHPVCGRIVQALFSASENDTSSFGLKPNDKKNTTIHGEAAVRLDGGGIDPNPNKPPSSAPSSSCNESASEAAAAAAAIPSNRSTSPLDDSQREAIAFALSNNNTRCPIALIHGPVRASRSLYIPGAV